MLPALLRCVLAAVLVVLLAAVAHAAGRATVRGALAVNVRRGPSPDSPAFVALPKGNTVRVEKVVGDWALITLDSGQQGYVKASFLDLPAGIEVVALQTAAPALKPPPPSALPTETAGAAAATPETHGDAGRRDELEHELAQLRDRLVALESVVVPTPGGATPAGHEAAEAAPAAPASGGEPTHAAGALLPTAVQTPESQEIGPSLALAGVGLVVGFLLGAGYGRRQERNRRSRVRF